MVHPLPCFQQDVTPPDPVIQRMETAFRLSLGRDIQATLEFSRFGEGFAFAVAFGGVVGSYDHAHTLTSTRKGRA